MDVKPTIFSRLLDTYDGAIWLVSKAHGDFCLHLLGINLRKVCQ